MLLNEDVESKIHKHIENKINIQNVLNFYQLAKLFGLSCLANVSFKYIQRCFTMLVESQSFLELDYASISRIFASSGLLITSELEVYGAGDKWLSYNKEERSKFAEDILQKVRLPLLSDETLKYLINKSSSFTNSDACISKIKEILKHKEDFISNSCKNYTNIGIVINLPSIL